MGGKSADLSGRPNKWLLNQLYNHLKADKISSVREMLTKTGQWVQDMRRMWDVGIHAGLISKPDNRLREDKDKGNKPQRNPKRDSGPDAMGG